MSDIYEIANLMNFGKVWSVVRNSESGQAVIEFCFLFLIVVLLSVVMWKGISQDLPVVLTTQIQCVVQRVNGDSC